MCTKAHLRLQYTTGAAKRKEQEAPLPQRAQRVRGAYWRTLTFLERKSVDG